MGAERVRGRPRDPETDARILAAALGQLTEDGFTGMSIDAVARAAGVSKATIYRRFTGKDDLATAAIATLPPPEFSEDAGDTRTRLVQMLDNVRANVIDGPGIEIHHQILAEARRNPELVRMFRERKITPRRAMVRALLEDGVQNGEIRGDVELDYVAELLAGSWMARWAGGGAFPDDWSEQVVATIWPAIAA